jgi:hypothetical protein
VTPFLVCTKEAEARSWAQLGPVIKDKVIRFEVLPEDEWEAKLNEMLEMAHQ